MSDSEEDTSEKPLKLVVIGDGTCGKTSLVKQFVHGNGTKDYDQTVGVEFHLKHISLQGRTITVQVWDIGGQTLGGKMLEKYVYGSHGILLVYDIMNHNSFDNLEDWLDCVRSICTSRGIIPHIALIANKCDMEHFRVIPLEKHNHFAESNYMSSRFVSAKTGESVNVCFQKIVAAILGIHLTKTDQDSQQAVVKAEIITEKAECPTPSLNASRFVIRSGICTIQ